ncbi:hypothetical protein WK25_05950 [Burkholderia latens]|uniref:hypothetical protein n=1 Tax=Burkholderia latens TaxID=488446 RepID=UPI000841A699|nr:hypothetical protein [Burkholderia latens]AOK04050.1 hypothetical protein WK25_05950 [Burkholderia latens]
MDTNFTPLRAESSFVRTQNGRLIATVWVDYPENDVSEEARHLAVVTAYSRAKEFAAASDMLMVLEMLASDADAGKVMIPSGLRLSIDAALIKAGRKPAPTPVRHITMAGGAR